MSDFDPNLHPDETGTIPWFALGDRYADGITQTSRWMARVKQGQLQPIEAARWMATIHSMVSYTVPTLELAQRVARERGHQKLADALGHGRDEEAGHDRWSEADLNTLLEGLGSEQRKLIQPSPSAAALKTFLHGQIHERPEQILVYAFLTEYLTVKIGPSLMADLVERCHVPADALSVIGKHVELDEHHIEEDLSDFTRFIATDRPNLDACTATIKGSFAFTVAAYDESLLGEHLPG
jgi:hypothetical protein